MTPPTPFTSTPPSPVNHSPLDSALNVKPAAVCAYFEVKPRSRSLSRFLGFGLPSLCVPVCVFISCWVADGMCRGYRWKGVQLERRRFDYWPDNIYQVARSLDILRARVCICISNLAGAARK